MDFKELVAEAARLEGLELSEATMISKLYYKNLKEVLKEGFGGKIPWTKVGVFHHKITGARILIKYYTTECLGLISVRNGKSPNYFPTPQRYIWKTHKVVQELGSIVLSLLHYHYEINKTRRDKKPRTVDLELVKVGIYWLDRLIGTPFNESYCTGNNTISKKIVRRMRKQGFVEVFRRETGCYPVYSVQHLWLYPKIEDSLLKVQLPDHIMVKKKHGNNT